MLSMEKTHLASLQRGGMEGSVFEIVLCGPRAWALSLGARRLQVVCLEVRAFPTTLASSPLLCRVSCSAHKCCRTLQVTPGPRRARPAEHALSVKDTALASCQRTPGGSVVLCPGRESALEAGWECLSWGGWGRGISATRRGGEARGATGCPCRVSLEGCL